MLKLYEDRYHNIIDIVLFLLLLLANSWASANFPQHVDWNNHQTASDFSSAGLACVFFGAIPALLCFFFHSRGSTVQAQTWLGSFSRIIEVIGIFIMSFTVSIMFVLFLVLLTFIIIPSQSDGWFALVFIIAFLSIFILPFWLMKKYFTADKKTVREINPSLRYLMLVPAIFLTSAMWNANALGIFPDGSDGTLKSWCLFQSGKVCNYIFFYSAPRMFATGKPIELNNCASWAIGSALYFVGLSY